MAEYIERMPKCSECIHNGVCYMQEICNNIEEQLREFGCDNFKPTADVVEVVMCKYCKHYCADWLRGLSKYNNYGHCKRIEFLSQEHTTRFEDDFCSYGERTDT